MFAIIETGGKQYLIKEGDRFDIEKLDKKKGGLFKFDKVLLMGRDMETIIGKPYITGAEVEAKIDQQTRARKIKILRYHSKTRQRRRKGHRQHLTKVSIQKIK